MRTRRTIILSLMAAIATFIVVNGVSPNSGNLVKGHTVNEWIKLLPDTYNLSKTGDNPTEILSEIGAEAVPSLIAALRQKDSKPKVAAISALNKLPGVNIRYVPARDRYVWAQMAFHPQKATALAAVPQLVDMLTQPDVETRRLPDWAANQLSAIGEPAVAALLDQLGGTNTYQRVAAISTLETFECAGWTQNHLMIRDYMPGYHAPFQIKHESGERITHALRGLLLDSDSSVRTAATNALKMFQENNPLRQKNMMSGKSIKLTKTRDAGNEAKRSRGEAVPLSPSEGERAGVRGIPAPTEAQITRARTLRKKSSWAEKLLWRLLPNERFSGYKFKRPHPFGPYTLDFFCAEARVVLETDGFQHGHPSQQEHDAKRDVFLARHGIVVKRVWNWRLRREPQVVRDNLWMLLQERAPHPGNVKPAKRVTSRVLNPDRPTAKTPHPALSPSDGERVNPRTTHNKPNTPV